MTDKAAHTNDHELIKEGGMPDHLLREIRDVHQLRKDIPSLPPARAEEFMKKLGDVHSMSAAAVAAGTLLRSASGAQACWA